MYYGILGRKAGKGRFAPLDFGAGRFVTNVIFQTLWDEKGEAQAALNKLKSMNTEYEWRLGFRH